MLTLGNERCAMALHACITFLDAVLSCRDDLPHCSVSPADAVAQEDRDCKHPGVISTALTL